MMPYHLPYYKMVTIESESLKDDELQPGYLYFINTQLLGKDKLLTKEGGGDFRNTTFWQTVAKTIARSPQDFVLIIDEAQDLTDDLLEQVRLLSNLETDNRKLLQIVLLGQPELKEMLEKKEIVAKNKEDNKSVALGTSRINYMDPRITISWCKRNCQHGWEWESGPRGNIWYSMAFDFTNVEDAAWFKLVWG